MSLQLFPLSFSMTKPHQGFTLIEVLIVVSIISLLSLSVIFAISKQKTKTEDVAMKADLGRLKTAFEDYYNDHNCYPPKEWFDGPEDINNEALKPYLDRMLYNKKTHLPYVLEKDSTGCRWFKLYTTLNDPDDPQAVLLRTTDPALGSTLGNYGISSSNTIVHIFYNISNQSNTYYCSAIGNCSSFDNTTNSCTPSYGDPNCSGSNTCANIGTCTPL